MTSKDIRQDKKESIKQGAIMSLPMILGFLPISMAFGLLAKNSGMSFFDTWFMSFIVFAGSSQFMVLDLLNAGVTMGSMILATFLLNLRHMMMSASLSLDFKDLDRKYLPLVGFGITDESFSIVSFNKEKIDLPYILTLFFLAHTAWWGGTVIGYLIGEILPNSLQLSLSVGLYAMFAALLFPQIKKARRILSLVIISMVIYSLIYYSKVIDSGWDIILGIILSSALCVYLFDEKRFEKNE